MKKNVLSLIEVMATSKELVGASLGEKCVSVNVPVLLLDENNELKQYLSHSICREVEEEDAKIRIKELSGLTKEEFIKKNPYCHVSTYPADYAGKFLVSFDSEDDIPCKVEFSDGYNYLDLFFYRFNNMRNKLIDNKEIVKDDDIYQYLDIVLGRLKRKNKKENKFQELKKKFINSK